MKLATRRFEESDQQRFGAASGDLNPMHMDALYARRTQAGRPVVHGIHLLLWALDSLAAEVPDLTPLSRLRVQLSRFIYLKEPVDLELVQLSESRIRLNITVDGVARSRVTLEFGGALEACPDFGSGDTEPTRYSRAPWALPIEQMQGLSGRLPFRMTEEQCDEMFPAATRWLGPARIAALASTTHLVGMICPGLHSIYSELTAHTCNSPGSGAVLDFRVPSADARFRAVETEFVGGGLAGSMTTFVRTAPVEQATMESLKEHVDACEFSGSIALVVGGSRGLGELTAKLLAAGGAHVIVTWQSGEADARRVAEEIRSAGRTCDTLRYDACQPAAEQLAGLLCVPTHAYYFATPVIAGLQSAIFAPARLGEFLSFYVDAFWSLAEALRARHPALSLFYPSSVFVSERPAGMTEYAMAKAAGEVLCDDMNRLLQPLRVTVSQLPRMATDQTASIAEVETASALETMLPLIRQVQAGRGEKL